MKNFGNAVRDFVLEWSVNIIVLLFGTTTLVQAFIVPTPSMDKTVMVGDHLLVDKLSYAPPGSISKYFLPYTEVKRGDIIVFRYPSNIQENYVKRVMGVPGDHLRVVNKVLYLNGKPLTEPYTQHVRDYIDPYADNFPSEPVGPVDQRGRAMLQEHVVNGEVVVPEGSYFAMGDNRDNSLDSRYWGFMPRDYVKGKAAFIYWSFEDNEEGLPPAGFSRFFTTIRWSRLLHQIH